MSFGLQLWDSAGNLSLDASSRLNRWVGDYAGSRNNPNPGTNVTTFVDDVWDISVPGIANDGSWAFIISNSVIMTPARGPAPSHPTEIIRFNTGSGSFPLLDNAYFNITEASIIPNAIRCTWRTVRWGLYDYSGFVEIFMTNSYTVSVFRY